MKKYLVYEQFSPPYKQPVWGAVEADGKHGFMEGIAPESRVYSWWAEDSPAAIQMVETWLRDVGARSGKVLAR